MGGFTWLSLEERTKIESLIKQGLDYPEIAKQTGRTYSSIRKEIEKAGGFLKYNALEADKAAQERRSAADKRRMKNMNEGIHKNPFKVAPEAPVQEAPITLSDLMKKLNSVNYAVVDLKQLVFDMLYNNKKEEGFKEEALQT